MYLKTRQIRRTHIPFLIEKGILYNLKVLFRKSFYPHNNSLFDKYISFCKETPYEKSDFFSSFSITHYGLNEWQSKEIIRHRTLHKFEDTNFYIIEGYDQWQSSLFGDYMTLPPKERQLPGHSHMKYYWKDR